MRFIHTATVYTENVPTGNYDVVAKANLPCRSIHVGGATTVQDRASLGRIRHLIWAAEYEMPEDCQVEVKGTRYQPMIETFKTITGPNGEERDRSVDMMQVR